MKLVITKKPEPNASQMIAGKFKRWKCMNCGRDRLTEDNIKMIMCGCGEFYREVKA